MYGRIVVRNDVLAPLDEVVRDLMPPYDGILPHAHVPPIDAGRGLHSIIG